MVADPPLERFDHNAIENKLPGLGRLAGSKRRGEGRGDVAGGAAKPHAAVAAMPLEIAFSAGATVRRYLRWRLNFGVGLSEPSCESWFPRGLIILSTPARSHESRVRANRRPNVQSIEVPLVDQPRHRSGTFIVRRSPPLPSENPNDRANVECKSRSSGSSTPGGSLNVKKPGRENARRKAGHFARFLLSARLGADLTARKDEAGWVHANHCSGLARAIEKPVLLPKGTGFSGFVFRGAIRT